LKGDLLFFESKAGRLLKDISSSLWLSYESILYKISLCCVKPTAVHLNSLHRNLDCLLLLFWIENEVPVTLIIILYEGLQQNIFSEFPIAYCLLVETRKIN
jgi:hypothetical protein